MTWESKTKRTGASGPRSSIGTRWMGEAATNSGAGSCQPWVSRSKGICSSERRTRTRRTKGEASWPNSFSTAGTSSRGLPGTVSARPGGGCRGSTGLARRLGPGAACFQPGGLLRPMKALEQPEQDTDFDRLAERRPDQGVLPDPIHVAARREHDGGRSRSVPQLLEQLEAVHHRHHEVEQHQVRLRTGAEAIEGELAVRRGLDRPVLHAKHVGARLPDVRVVLDQKDASRPHGGRVYRYHCIRQSLLLPPRYESFAVERLRRSGRRERAQFLRDKPAMTRRAWKEDRP